MTKKRIIEFIKRQILLWICLLYPGSKFVLSLFNLNWRSFIDEPLYTVSVLSLALYIVWLFSKYTNKFWTVFVAVVIGPLFLMYAMVLYAFNYSGESGEFINSKGEQIIVYYEDDIFEQGRILTYKAYGPCFKTARPIK